MMVDLKNAINSVLKANFPETKIYPGEVDEGFNKPAFFTQIIPITSDYETTNFTSHRLMVVVNYYNKGSTELDNLKMHDKLKKAYGMTLKVNHRSFLLKNIRSEIVDEVLQFRFDLDFLVNQEKIDEHELAGEINTEIRSD